MRRHCVCRRHLQVRYYVVQAPLRVQRHCVVQAGTSPKSGREILV